MKTNRHTYSIHSVLLILFSLAVAGTVQAQVPGVINYQGRVSNAGANPPGPTVDFKFAIVNPNGGTTHWSHDGTSVNGSEPSGFITLGVAEGLFSVALGDTSILGMTRTVPVSVFGNNDVRLRIWVRDPHTGSASFELLLPDQRFGSVGYAMMSAGVINGAIGPNKLANDSISVEKLQDGAVSTDKILNGAVTPEKLAPGAVTSAALSPSLDLGAAGVCGLLDLFSTDVGTPGVTLDGCQSEISAFAQNNGVEGVELKAFDFGGLLSLRDPNARLNLQAGSAANGGGFASLFNDLHVRTVLVDGSDANRAGFVGVANRSGFDRVLLLGEGENQAGEIVVNSAAGRNTILLKGQSDSAAAGEILLQSVTGQPSLQLAGTDTLTQGGSLSLMQGNGVRTIELHGEGDNGSYHGSFLNLRNQSGDRTVRILGNEPDRNGGNIQLFRPGTTEPIIELDVADETSGHCGRIKTPVLEITGGCDLSENFNIKSSLQGIEPGMIVCIDPENPGHLVSSSRSYDSTVAGIVSGAGGVRPGMLMGQHGNPITGKHPVALTGRVYCLVDADRGAIRPGELITTSDTPGHGMRVLDPSRAAGAVIGKAMTGLAAGKGLVLVLVSLQ